MKFYYTILKISPNTASTDAISIGLLAFNEQKAIISFSESRKQLVKKLIAPELVDFFCKQLSLKVKELNQSHKKNLGSLFSNDYVFELPYFDN